MTAFTPSAVNEAAAWFVIAVAIVGALVIVYRAFGSEDS